MHRCTGTADTGTHHVHDIHRHVFCAVPRILPEARDMSVAPNNGSDLSFAVLEAMVDLLLSLNIYLGGIQVVMRRQSARF